MREQGGKRKRDCFDRDLIVVLQLFLQLCSSLSVCITIRRPPAPHVRLTHSRLAIDAMRNNVERLALAEAQLPRGRPFEASPCNPGRDGAAFHVLRRVKLGDTTRERGRGRAAEGASLRGASCS